MLRKVDIDLDWWELKINREILIESQREILINEYQHAVIKIFLNPTNFIHQNNILFSRKVYQMQK